MTIEHISNDKKGYFKASDEGKSAGEMHYTWAGTDKLIIDHTEVFSGFEGKGVGKQLLMKVVDFAREKHIKILPLCPYAKSVFDKTETIKDVLF